MSNAVTISYKKIATISIILNILLISAFFLFNPAANTGQLSVPVVQSQAENQNAVETTNENQFSEQNQTDDQQNQQTQSEEQQQIPPELQAKINEYAEIAKAFFIQTPTFSFDGLTDDVQIELISLTEEEMHFNFKFYSSHPGFGDRYDAPVPEQKTFHEMIVIVRDGKAVSAVTDRKYDEINKQYALFGEMRESMQ